MTKKANEPDINDAITVRKLVIQKLLDKNSNVFDEEQTKLIKSGIESCELEYEHHIIKLNFIVQYLLDLDNIDYLTDEELEDIRHNVRKSSRNKNSKKAKQLQFLTHKFVSPANRGVPDRIFITPVGEVFFIEFKSIKGKLTSLQKYEINKLQNYQIDIHVVRDIEDGLTILDYYSCV